MTIAYTEDLAELDAQMTDEWPEPIIPGTATIEHVQRIQTADETPDQADGEQHRGQVRIAYRLAAAYADRLMYVRGLGWHHWDGTRWATDETGRAEQAVLDVLRSALGESLDDKELRADVRKCETANGIDGVLKIAASLPALRVAHDALDADPHMLNCANGTLDLHTLTLHPHEPSDRLTRVTRGAYRPDADTTTWTRFLDRSLPDQDERDYLRRVIGQGVYGAVREHLFPVLTGEGANGKGTAYTAVVHALGDYAAIIDPSLLMTSDRGPGGPELLQLLGTRLVVGSETNEGKQLDAALMKRLSGGDQLTARNLYQPPVTWKPSHQLLYVTNHLPKVKGNDPAVWRRVRVIPFDVVIPEDERDPELGDRLEQSADAILTWAVQGWTDYADGGMREPANVLHATDEYQTDSDPVKRFVAEACVTGANMRATSGQLFDAWTTWAEENGVKAGSKRALGGELDRLGYEKDHTNMGTIRLGIGVPVDAE